ncbi:MAG: hypothetical protein JWP87_5750 [Labilithrix sp.]|nr:hypothetical protein [Labilithrix sp.]
MSRSSSHALADRALANDSAEGAPADLVYGEQPTRRLPKFILAEEARRLDMASERDEDATVTIGAEENKKLLASVFAAAPAPAPAPGRDERGDRPNTDDEPTLDAPCPIVDGMPAFEAAPPRPVCITARPPALRTLVITKPAPARKTTPVAPAATISPDAVPPSFPRAAPSLVMTLAAIAAPAIIPAAVVAPVSGFRPKISPELRKAVRDLREAEDRRRSATTFRVYLPKPNAQTYVVAGIWAMALSLLAVLMFMATSA